MTTRRGFRAGDEGMTLIELLVAMSLVMVIAAGSLTTVILSSDVVKLGRDVQNLNEEARHAVNRMARDLRQAEELVVGLNPAGPAHNEDAVVAVRFRADYDGDGCSGTAAAGCLPHDPSNPEDVTYCFDPGERQLYIMDNQVSGLPVLTASSTSCEGGQPLLAGNVSSLGISYRSSAYLYDTDGDGVTDWTELDSAGLPVGNSNGVLDAELAGVNSLVLELTVSVDGHSQDYRTQVDLRNRTDVLP